MKAPRHYDMKDCRRGTWLDLLVASLLLVAVGEVFAADAAPARVVVTEEQLVTLEPVYFQADRDEVDSASYVLLDEVVRVMSRRPTLSVRVEGHTDAAESGADGRPLSQRRADSVVRYLVSKGVAPSRLQAIGFGASRPLVANDAPEAGPQNRRTEFHVVTDAHVVTAGPMSLAECLDFAYAHNFDLRGAEIGVALREQRIREADSALMPRLSLDGHVLFSPQKPMQEVEIPPDVASSAGIPQRFSFATSTQNPRDFKLTLSQPVFAFGRLYNGVQQRRAEQGMAAGDAEQSRSDLAFSVVRAFYDVLLAERTLRSQEDVAGLTDAVVEDARRRSGFGSSSQMELLDAESEHTQAQLPALQARSNLRQKRNTLKKLLGWEHEDAIELAGELTFRPYPQAQEADLIRESLERRPDLRELDAQLHAKQLEVEAALLAYTPTVSLTGSYEFLQHERLDLPENVLSGGVALSWPIFDGLTQLARWRQAKLAVDQVKLRRKSLEASVRADVANALEELRLSEETYYTHEEAEKTAAARMHLAESSQKAGKMALLEVTRERIALLRESLHSAEMIHQHVVAKAELDHVTGAPPGDF